MLKLMYITNQTEVAKIAESALIDRIFVDMEYINKNVRQGGMNTVQNKHTLNDVEKIRQAVKKAQVLVRCNPIHDETADYTSSKEEINGIVDRGADVIMLPYFKTDFEVEEFINLVNGRAKTTLLLETPEAVSRLDRILEINGIDEIHIGLNDLSIGYGKRFMFELLADGTVDKICNKIKAKGIPYGFGGIASLGKGLLPSEKIIAEHYRLGSTRAILSRSFCDTSTVPSLKEIEEIFVKGVHEIRAFERDCQNGFVDFKKNRTQLINDVDKIVERLV